MSILLPIRERFYLVRHCYWQAGHALLLPSVCCFVWRCLVHGALSTNSRINTVCCLGYLPVNQKKTLPGSLLPHPHNAPRISQSKAKYPLLKYHQNANILFPINAAVTNTDRRKVRKYPGKRTNFQLVFVHNRSLVEVSELWVLRAISGLLVGRFALGR